MILYIIFIAAGFVAGFVAMYALVLRIAGSKRKRFEFSKILAVWAAIMATAIAVVVFVLAACDKQPVSDFATLAFSTCVAYLVSYAGKSAFEKNSRNKHRLDENGKPYDGKGG